MSLFNDEEEKPEKTKLQRWLHRIFYGLLIFAAFVWITLRLLMSIGGNSDPLRQGLEQAMASATGLQTRIYQFNYMKFFPDVSIDAANIVFSAKMPAGKPSPPLATIGELKASVSFWATFFSRYEVKELAVSDIDLKGNPYLVRPLHIDTIALEKDGLGPGQPACIIKGRYGGDSFQGSVTTAWTAAPGTAGYFSPAEKSRFSFQSTFLTMTGTLLPGADGIHIAFDSIGTPEILLTGAADFGPESFGADLKGGGGEFVLDVKHAKGGYSGSLHMPSLDIADTKLMAAAGTLYDLAMPLAWVALAGKDTKIDFDVQADQLTASGTGLGHLSFPVHAAAGILTAGPLKGEIAGGAAAGQLTLDSSKSPLSLTLKFVLQNMQYGVLQKALIAGDGLPGQATIDVTVTSEATAADDLAKNLKGEAAIVGGAGELAVSVLDKAAPGLTKILLPQADPQGTLHLNCLLADFRIKDGVATADPLFLNANEAAIAGAGNVNLAGKTIDLTLTPKPGKPAGAAAARLSGPLANPVVRAAKAAAFPDKITPSFLSFSMTDLGLDDKHPCHAFIGKAAP
jgi:hypothetical protein